jgi:hypothetical protein
MPRPSFAFRREARLTIAAEKIEARMGKMLRRRNRVHKPN